MPLLDCPHCHAHSVRVTFRRHRNEAHYEFDAECGCETEGVESILHAAAAALDPHEFEEDEE